MPKLSTYEQLIQDPKRKKKLDTEYRELLISELVEALVQKDYKAALKLAQEVEFPVGLILELQKGNKQKDELNLLAQALASIGYRLSVEPNVEE